MWAVPKLLAPPTWEVLIQWVSAEGCLAPDHTWRTTGFCLTERSSAFKIDVLGLGPNPAADLSAVWPWDTCLSISERVSSSLKWGKSLHPTDSTNIRSVTTAVPGLPGIGHTADRTGFDVKEFSVDVMLKEIKFAKFKDHKRCLIKISFHFPHRR